MESYGLLLNNNSYTKEQAKRLEAKFKETLKGKGIEVEYDEENNNIHFYFYEREINQSLKRNAGRRKKLSEIRMSEVLAMKEQGMSKKDIQEKLQIPHATFYRKWKRMEEYINSTPEDGRYDALF